MMTKDSQSTSLGDLKCRIDTVDDPMSEGMHTPINALLASVMNTPYVSFEHGLQRGEAIFYRQHVEMVRLA